MVQQTRKQLLNSKFTTPLRFGTSGVRGLVVDMTDMECYINTRGFIKFLHQIKEIKSGDSITLAGDLRQSTPRIMRAVHKAILDEGGRTVYCGFIPTPTLSYFSWKRQLPAIMVTGSHIPEELNGIKFIKSKEEVLKNDEKGILSNVTVVREEEYAKDEGESMFDANGMFKRPVDLPSESEEKNALLEFQKRFTDIFPSDILTGKRIVVYEQSAVGRDLLGDILASLGAEVIRSGRSDKFIPMDTEKMPNSAINLLKQLAKEFQPFAVVSTDGDSDRPILADENGSFLFGDLLCTLVSLYLKPDFAAMTAPCDHAIIGILKKELNTDVSLTKVGSPYVIASMDEKLAKYPNAKVVSWERNGGYLTGSNFSINNKILGPLPTRDAIFPIVITIISSIEAGVSLSTLISSKLPSHITISGAADDETKGFESYTALLGKTIVKSLSPVDSSVEDLNFVSTTTTKEADGIKSRLELYFSHTLGFTDIVSINYIAGIRITFSNNDVIHLRPSNNAPEFRFYITADTQKRADEILADCFVVIPIIISDIT